MNDVGSTLLALPPRTLLRRFRLPGADLYVVVLEGDLAVVDETGDETSYRRGELAVCLRGRAWTLRSDRTRARLLVVAVPGGPEEAFHLLLAGGAGWGEQLQRVADAGVEVLLDD